MTVLLVDDNRFVLQSLSINIDWKSLSVTKVLTASNMQQAQEIFLQNNIDLLICDIEMPQGSGLELLSWIRMNKYNTETIFLTNYADFNYAQKAIELQSFDYFLKPIEFDKLTLIIKKALSKIENKKINLQSPIKINMLKHIFWEKIITRNIFPSNNEIKKMLLDLEISYSEDTIFKSILICFKPVFEIISSDNDSIYSYGMQSILDEILQNNNFKHEICYKIPNEYSWIIIFKYKDNQTNDNIIKNLCVNIIDNCKNYYSSKTNCFISKHFNLYSSYEGISFLFNFNLKFMSNKNIIFTENIQSDCNTYPLLNINLLKNYLLKNDICSFSEYVNNYINVLKNYSIVKYEFLHELKEEILNLYSVVCKEKEINFNNILKNINNDILYTSSIKSLDDINLFCLKYANIIISNDSTSKSHNTVDDVKEYILNNLHENLSRNNLAEHFFLNPDYLARIFAKQEKISLGNFITISRIEKAKKLLQNPNVNIGEVAIQVGYNNYSHFSKIFKEITKLSPNEYKKQFR